MGLQLEDLFLYGLFCDEAEDLHTAGLPEPVGAVGGLVLGGDVPPRVVVDDNVRAGEVETGAAGFQRDEEDVCLAGVEIVHQLQAVCGAGLTGEQEVADTHFRKACPQDLQHGGELGENEHPMSAFDGRGDQVGAKLQLCTLARPAGTAEGGMAADLPQAREQREEPDGIRRMAAGGKKLPEFAAGLGQGGIVELLLLPTENGGDDTFDLFGKLGKHRFLQTAQDKGRHCVSQNGIHRAGVLGGQLIDPVETGLGGKKSRQDEVENAPQVGQRVLDRRSGQRKTGAGADALGGLGILGAEILDVLGFVGNAETELDRKSVV